MKPYPLRLERERAVAARSQRTEGNEVMDSNKVYELIIAAKDTMEEDALRGLFTGLNVLYNIPQDERTEEDTALLAVQASGVTRLMHKGIQFAMPATEDAIRTFVNGFSDRDIVIWDDTEQKEWAAVDIPGSNSLAERTLTIWIKKLLRADRRAKRELIAGAIVWMNGGMGGG